MKPEELAQLQNAVRLMDQSKSTLSAAVIALNNAGISTDHSKLYEIIGHINVNFESLSSTYQRIVADIQAAEQQRIQEQQKAEEEAKAESENNNADN